MKYAALLALLTASLDAQWITGHFAAQNGAMSVANIPWDKYTHIVHFAAAPNADGSVNMYYLIQAEINSLISSRPAGKKVVFCIKDNDSNYNAFSQATSSGTIATFVNNVVNFINANQYDGVDIDWEQNVNTAQYQDLLRRLRSALPAKLITIDTGNWNGLETAAGASASYLDQVNVMCYDMDGPANGYAWYNDALFQNGNPAVMTCDWRVRSLTNAGVPNAKIGIGIPFYTRRWPGVMNAMTSGNFTYAAYPYRTLVTDPTRWQTQYQFYDNGYKSNYLSIPSLNEFDSYNGTQSIVDAVAWQKAQGFGGFMTFTLDYEYLANQTGDASHPLSTALYNAAFGGSAAPNPGPVISSGAPTGTLSAGVTLTTLSVSTNVNATCRYSTTAGSAYSAMPYGFTVTGGTVHTAAVVGLQTAAAYQYYVRCIDTSGNVDASDYPIFFSVAAQTLSGLTGLSVSPNSGSGTSQSFTIQVSDSSPIQQIDAVFDTAQGRANSCQVELWAPTQTLFLRSDDNTTWSQALLGGATTATLNNSQCSVNVGASSLSTLGSTTSLKLAMSFASGYVGAKNVLGIASDQAGLSTAWQTLGSWTVPAAPVQPLSVKVSPANGYGVTATLALAITDASGAAAVQETSAFVGASLGAPYSCYIDYWAPSKTVSLRNDTNTAWSQGVLGSSTVLQNSSCSISLGSATVTSSGNVLTLTLHVSFTKHFLGAKQMYAFGADQAGRSTGWLNPGTWTVPRQR